MISPGQGLRRYGVIAAEPASVKNGEVWLGGSTASGKSEVALCLARELNGEIISIDSMQVYRGLDIGTAKPSTAEQLRVRHHLLDILDLKETFNVADFVDRARLVLADIRGRGKTAVLCGGTGLYFQALFEGIGSGPKPNPQLRATLEQTPLPTLLAELEQTDRECYRRIDKQNARRVIRAVEVLRLAGRPVAQQHSPWSKERRARPGFFVLKRDPEDLRRRIEERVDRMFELGLVAETEYLLKCGLAQNRTALQAIGYRQVVEHLRGLRSLPETIELVKRRTTQFARRQRNWFENRLPGQIIPVDRNQNPETIANQIVVDWNHSKQDVLGRS